MSRLGGDGIHADSHARCVAVHSLPCAAVLLLLLSVLTMTSARHALQNSKSKGSPVESFMQMLTCHMLARRGVRRVAAVDCAAARVAAYSACFQRHAPAREQVESSVARCVCARIRSLRGRQGIHVDGRRAQAAAKDERGQGQAKRPVHVSERKEIQKMLRGPEQEVNNVKSS